MPRYAPPGWHSVTPRLFVSEERRMVEFLRQVFAATGACHASRPAEMRIGDSIVMVSSDAIRGPTHACLYVYVADVDAVYERALQAGASSLEPPQLMPYGDRRCMVEDEWGNLWQIAARARRAAPRTKRAKRKTVAGRSRRAVRARKAR